MLLHACKEELPLSMEIQQKCGICYGAMGQLDGECMKIPPIYALHAFSGKPPIV